MVYDEKATANGMARDLSENTIRDALSAVIDIACVSDLSISPNGEVLFLITVDAQAGPEMEDARIAAEQAVSKLKDVTKVTAILTAEKKEAPDPHGMNKNPRLILPIKHIIAVASGKGGVGKSTVAFNLAVALSRAGHSVGLLDADIYGPSVPMLAGLQNQKPEQVDGHIMPLEAHGLKIMSIGFMVAPEKALIWRGPMVQTALYQMLRDVQWAKAGEMLDYLIIDMPPGTGDAQLTLAQKVPVTGAVIVSTPQDLALIDARKAIQMFEQTNVRVLGLIENMSTHVCSHCGHEESIFGQGGVEKEAQKIGLPFLGALPLSLMIRKSGDAGEPVNDPVFKDIAGHIVTLMK